MSESEGIVRLDVRDQIKTGREPFSQIMGTVGRLEAGQKFLLVAPFEPAPLYAVMAQRGFSSVATVREDGDWEILFSPAPAQSEEIIDVDARGLEPPEPLVKILEAVARLPKGATLRAHTDRRPVHLHTHLEERGFSGESEEQGDGSFVTSIVQRLT